MPFLGGGRKNPGNGQTTLLRGAAALKRLFIASAPRLGRGAVIRVTLKVSED